MDPNAALAEIREIVANADDNPEALLDRLPDLVSGLDEWLTGGGFQPSAWGSTAVPQTVTAYVVPHNEGVEVGIVTGPGFNGNGGDFCLTDLYEVDASLESFGTVAEARDWLNEQGHDVPDIELAEVPGGLRGSSRLDDEEEEDAAEA